MAEWIQGGTDTRVFPGPRRLTTAGELILNVNDGIPEDNTEGWRVTVVQKRPDPAPPPSAGPALEVEAIQFVQSIQNSTNGVPLVRGKRAIARVFVHSGTSGSLPNVTGRLTATRVSDGFAFPPP